MSMNDTISDFLTRIRNAYRAKHTSVQVPYTKITEKIARVLLDVGYLADVQVAGCGVRKSLVIGIKYVDGISSIIGLRRVSKPSCRRYVGYKDIKPIMNGLGVTILSTPAGVMSDAEARRKQVGGELLCTVW